MCCPKYDCPYYRDGRLARNVPWSVCYNCDEQEMAVAVREATLKKLSETVEGTDNSVMASAVASLLSGDGEQYVPQHPKEIPPNGINIGI